MTGIANTHESIVLIPPGPSLFLILFIAAHICTPRKKHIIASLSDFSIYPPIINMGVTVGLSTLFCRIDQPRPLKLTPYNDYG
jgi:hypothetical protein